MICLKNINIEYNSRSIFENQDIEINNNCLTLIKGESGSGKTTLLYRIGLLETRDFNKYIIDDKEIPLNDEKLIFKIRRENIGYVFQEYMLYDRLNVLENMQYFASMVGKNLLDEDATKILQKVNLDIPLYRTLTSLSGGQKQRLAIACVLAKDPDVLILDEPSSALDKDNAYHIFQILKDLSRSKTVIITSHNEDAQMFCDEVIDIKDGIIKKIKSLNVENEKNINLNKNKNRITHISYMKKNDRYSFKQKRLIALINSVIMIGLLGIIHLISTGIEDSKLLISLDNKAQIYIKDMKDSDLNCLSNIEIYPIYRNQVMINGIELDVIPLFYKTTLNSKLWTIYDTSGAEGFYFSYYGYKELIKQVVPQKYIEFYDLSNMKELEIVYKGILLNGVENEYTQSSKYILVDHKLIEEKFTNSNRLGYTLFFEDYGEYSKTKGNLEKLGYNVEGLNGIEEIEKYIELLTYLKYFSIALGALICGFGISFVYKNYIDSRKKEIALLQCNGIINNHIINMFYKEFISLNVFCFLTGLAIKCFLPGVSFIYMFIFEALILFVIYVLLHRIIQKINPIDILRDNE